MDKKTVEKLNNVQKIVLVLTALINGDIVNNCDRVDVESALRDGLAYYGYMLGESLCADINDLGGITENLLALIIVSCQEYPEYNKALCKGYTDVYWLFDNENCSNNSLESYEHESDWLKRLVEIYVDIICACEDPEDHTCDGMKPFLDLDLDGILEITHIDHDKAVKLANE